MEGLDSYQIVSVFPVPQKTLETRTHCVSSETMVWRCHVWGAGRQRLADVDTAQKHSGTLGESLFCRIIYFLQDIKGTGHHLGISKSNTLLLRNLVCTCVCFFGKQGNCLTFLTCWKLFTKPTGLEGRVHRHFRKPGKFSIPQLPFTPPELSLGGISESQIRPGGSMSGAWAVECQPGKRGLAERGESAGSWKCIPWNTTCSAYCFVHQEKIALLPASPVSPRSDLAKG